MRKFILTFACSSAMFASGAALADGTQDNTMTATAQPVALTTGAGTESCRTYFYHEGMLVKSGKCLTSLQRHDEMLQQQQMVTDMQLRALLRHN